MTEQLFAVVTQFADGIADVVERKVRGGFLNAVEHIGRPAPRELLERAHIEITVVKIALEIGHLTGKQTIAEFAENPEIITMLRGMGIDYAQGYGVSEPTRLLQAVA